MASALVGSNEDLLSEILSRLPVKRICGFKCVSKLCNSIISNPWFRDRISRETCKRITGVFVFMPSTMSEYDIVPLYKLEKETYVSSLKSLKYERLRIMQSCNGLLCCKPYYDSITSLFNFYVCNPTTLQFKKLPDPIRTKFVRNISDSLVYGVYLAFDPRKSSHYKVLCVYRCLTSRFYQTEMYSSEMGQWRRVGDPFNAEDVNFWRGVYWNGAINWLSYSSEGLYFNVDEERTGKLPMLPLSNGRRNTEFVYFGESNDHLHLVEPSHDSAKQFFKIYEMDKEYSGWSIRYHVDSEVVMDACSFAMTPSDSFHSMFAVLSVVSGGGIDEDPCVVLFSKRGKTALRYNLVSKRCNKICDLTSSHFYSRLSVAFPYIESIHAV